MSTVDRRDVAPCPAVLHALVKTLAANVWLDSFSSDKSSPENSPRRYKVPPVARTLDYQVLKAEEAQLGTALPDDILALFGAQCDEINKSWLCQLGGLNERTAILRERLSRAELPGEATLVALGMQQQQFLCWDPSQPPGEDPYVSVLSNDKMVRSKRLSEWLNDKLDDSLENFDVPNKTINRFLSPENCERFFITIDSEKQAAPDRFVEHKKFGRGRVVEELPDGKLRIDFAGSEKLLMEKFVTEAV